MILTLIGMSGAGKSFWAGKLAAYGFTCFPCDALLIARLRTICGYEATSLVEVGRWMGLPHEPGFRQREALYLRCEMDVLREVIARATLCADNRIPCVIDTGGSAVYAGAELFQHLRRLSTIVYLAIPAGIHQQMLATYLADPLPLIWNGLFKQEQNEDLHDTFKRCYSLLIGHRERLYETYSDVTLEYDYYRQPALMAESFIQHIRTAAEHTRTADRLDRGDSYNRGVGSGWW